MASRIESRYGSDFAPQKFQLFTRVKYVEMNVRRDLDLRLQRGGERYVSGKDPGGRRQFLKPNALVHTRTRGLSRPKAQPDAKLLLLVRKIDGDSTNSLAVLVCYHDSEVAVPEFWKIAAQPLGEMLCYIFCGGVIRQFVATFVSHGL